MRNDETTMLAKQAFWATLSGGRAPTIDLVNDWFLINGHSKRNRNAISAALKTCWDELGSRVKQTRSIPDIPSETVDLVVALRDNLMKVATSQFDEERKELIARHAEQEKRAAADTAALEAELKGVVQTLETLTDSSNHAEADIARLTLALEAERHALASEKQQAAALADAVTKTRNDIRQGQALLTATRQEHAIELATEATRFNQMQHALQQQLDDEKTRATKLAKQLEKQENTITLLRDEATKRERTLSEQINDLTGQVGTQQGMNTVLQQQLTQARSDTENKLLALTAATDRIATLIAENTALAVQLANRSAPSPQVLQAMLEDAYMEGTKAREVVKPFKKASRAAPDPQRLAANEYAVKVVATL